MATSTMSMKLHTWMGFIFLSILVSCLTVKAKEPLQPLIFKAPLAYPESFDWDASHGRFLLGSITSGSIFSVSPAGNVEEFVNDDDYAGTAAVLGIHVDLPRNRVIAAVQNMNASDAPFSAVAAYELDTKKRIMFTELHHVGVQEGRFSKSASKIASKSWMMQFTLIYSIEVLLFPLLCQRAKICKLLTFWVFYLDFSWGIGRKSFSFLALVSILV
jgi:hypothetical protein